MKPVTAGVKFVRQGFDVPLHAQPVQCGDVKSRTMGRAEGFDPVRRAGHSALSPTHRLDGRTRGQSRIQRLAHGPELRLQPAGHGGTQPECGGRTIRFKAPQRDQPDTGPKRPCRCRLMKPALIMIAPEP